jgi:alanyl-tRNA synthetase
VTHRLYYTDAYTLSFDASVRGVDATGTRIVLDRTAFYPTSGGQPFDTGSLGDHRVVDVVEEENGEIAHLLDAPWHATIGHPVMGLVDADRRRDHREQHTAQHLISALCADHFGWQTVSVHFGAERSLIELDTERIRPEQFRALEQLADDTARRPLAVSVGFEDSGSALGLRKPPTREGEIRVVTIDGVDRSACGGTHVRNTVEVLPVVLVDMERMRGHMRVGFIAGQRALARAAADATLVARLAQSLGCAPTELELATEQLRQRVDSLEAERRKLRTALATLDARALHDGAAIGADGVRRIRIVHDDEPIEAQKPLVQALMALGGVIVCVTSTAPLGVLLAASSDVSLDCGRVLRDALVVRGGRGGGNTAQAQGTVPTVDALRDVCAAVGFE